MNKLFVMMNIYWVLLFARHYAMLVVSLQYISTDRKEIKAAWFNVVLTEEEAG